MVDRSTLSEENNKSGYMYQEIVAEHLTELTGKEATVKRSHGIDVVCGEFNIEVKGTKNLHKGEKRKGKTHYQVRGWKAAPHYCPAEITHFAFVLDEQHLCTFPLIYIVPISCIKQRFDQYPHSQWVHFPFHWVWSHYDFSLSKIPVMKDTEELRKNMLNSENGAKT